MIIGVDGNESNVIHRVGSNQYAFELLRALYNLNNEHQFIVYLREHPLPDMPKQRNNWSYRVIGPKALWTRWRLPIELFFCRPQPDIFFSPGHYAPFWSPAPVVISIMDLGFLQFPRQFTKRDLYQLTLWTTRSVKKASHILTISESTKDDIIKTYGIPRSRITVTYPGYDRKRFNARIKGQESKRVKEKYRISGNYILFLSTLKPSKNIEGLLLAYKLWSMGDGGLRLVIAGKKGWLYGQIFKKVMELGLEKQVIFTDFVSDADIPGLMAGAKIFVMPSFWEGFGIPVIEAMACGVPVVTSNVASLPEVVDKAGILVNPHQPEDIMRGMMLALEQRKEFVKKGLARVKKFSWEKCAKQTLEVLEEIRR